MKPDEGSDKPEVVFEREGVGLCSICHTVALVVQAKSSARMPEEDQKVSGSLQEVPMLTPGRVTDSLKAAYREPEPASPVSRKTACDKQQCQRYKDDPIPHHAPL